MNMNRGSKGIWKQFKNKSLCIKTFAQTWIHEKTNVNEFFTYIFEHKPEKSECRWNYRIFEKQVATHMKEALTYLLTVV